MWQQSDQRVVYGMDGWVGGWMDLMLVAVVDTFIGLEERRGEESHRYYGLELVVDDCANGETMFEKEHQ